jgi:hypothetical protein
VPVSSTTADRRLAELGVAKNGYKEGCIPTTDPMGRFVAFDRSRKDGTPRLGVTRTGLVLRTISPVPVTPVGLNVFPWIVIVPLMEILLNRADPLKIDAPATFSVFATVNPNSVGVFVK